MGIFYSKLTNSARITKWLLKLQPLKFQIEIIKWKDNVVADSLSRIPWPVIAKDWTEKLTLTLETDIEFAAAVSDVVDDNIQIPHAFDMKTIEEAQTNDKNSLSGDCV